MFHLEKAASIYQNELSEAARSNVNCIDLFWLMLLEMNVHYLCTAVISEGLAPENGHLGLLKLPSKLSLITRIGTKLGVQVPRPSFPIGARVNEYDNIKSYYR